MRKSRFSEAQIVGILHEGAAGGPVPEFRRARRHAGTGWRRRPTTAGRRSTVACR